MSGATSVIPVIGGAFSQQAADTTQWADTIDWTVGCDWLQVARPCCNLQLPSCRLSFNFNGSCDRDLKLEILAMRK